jgi:hypothetical protein
MGESGRWAVSWVRDSRLISHQRWGQWSGVPVVAESNGVGLGLVTKLMVLGFDGGFVLPQSILQL